MGDGSVCPLRSNCYRIDAIIALAALHRLPAVYGLRLFVNDGDAEHRLVGAAPLTRGVGRVLKGATPADLPVEQASKYQLVINLKTAKVLGLEIPPTLLARADEVIE